MKPTEWISIKNIPATNKYYLCYRKFTNCDGYIFEHYDVLCWSCEINKFIDGDWYDGYSDVMFWMPLPAPPEAKDD